MNISIQQINLFNVDFLEAKGNTIQRVSAWFKLLDFISLLLANIMANHFFSEYMISNIYNIAPLCTTYPESIIFLDLLGHGPNAGDSSDLEQDHVVVNAQSKVADRVRVVVGQCDSSFF